MPHNSDITCHSSARRLLATCLLKTHTMIPPYHSYLWQMSGDFKHSFTAELSKKFATLLLWRFPLHLRHVALPPRAVFKGGYGFKPPSRNYNKKKFSLYKNYMLHNMWPLLLGQKPLKCQEKPSGIYKMQQTTGAAGAPPRTALGELTALSQTP